MIKQNLKNTLKYAIKNPKVTSINIIGLALGLACAILIFLWVNDETSYEKFYTNADQIHLAYLKGTSGNNVSYQPTTSPVIAKRLKEEYPEVLEATSIFSLAETTIKYNDKIFNETTGIAADQSIFAIFNYHLVSGTSTNVLDDPFSIVLTESLAQKYFGRTDPIGKNLLLNNKFNFKVRAVMQDSPKNAYRKFDFIIPFNVLPQFDIPIEGSDFYPCAYFNYVLLHKTADYMGLNEKIRKNITFENESIKFEIELVPVTKTYIQESGGTGRLVIFSIISFFVLFLACINYTNLTIGTLISRFKEITIRRIIGANKRQLIVQLVSESIVMSFIALLVALLITYLLLGQFNSITNKQISFNFSDLRFVGFIILLALSTGVVSGLLPALKFASLKSEDILKSKFSSNSSIGRFRKGLVIFQFVITIFFLISTIVVQRQSNFISNYNVGFNKDNIYYAKLNEDVSNKIPQIRQLLQKNPQIVNVASASVLPNRIESGSFFPWGITEITHKRICEARVDYNFLELFDMKLVGGRFFNIDHPSDAEQSILISESALNLMQEKDAIGKTFRYMNDNFNLIGVVKDFQHSSALTSSPDPISYRLSPNNNDYLFVKINPSTNPVLLDQTVRYIHEVCDDFSPNRPIFYSFLNDVSYLAESQFKARGKLILMSTILTILISVIGLFGLVFLSVKYRIKEIGIRKVNGATISEITKLISFEYLKLVGISYVIAFPLAYISLQKLLEIFAHKIGLSWWIFALAGIIALGIALLTLSWQSWKAATRNPVEALRYE